MIAPLPGIFAAPTFGMLKEWELSVWPAFYVAAPMTPKNMCVCLCKYDVLAIRANIHVENHSYKSIINFLNKHLDYEKKNTTQ